MKIAIDGPAGAGKSVISRKLAGELNFIYVDTGALYRSVALYMLRLGIPADDAERISSVLKNVKVEIRYMDGEQHVFLCGEDVSDEIRTEAVSMATSQISAIPAVRDFLFGLQRSIAETNDCIMDGRDIGTVVLPDAEVKIFLTASSEVRADRRYKELTEKGHAVDYNEILEDIKKRDYNDSHRKTAPLKAAGDAVVFDTSLLTIEQVIDGLKKIIGEYEKNE